MVRQEHTTRDRRAALWMGISVFLMSWVPLVVALVGTTVGPFVFQFWHHLIMSIVWLVYLMWACPSLVWRKDIWISIVRCLPTREGIFATLNGFNSALFVSATLFLDTALVTVITGGWLVLFVVYRRRHDRYRRYTAMVVQDWLLMGTAVAGIALVTLSQSGSITADGSGWRLLCGLLLAVSTTICLAWISYRFKLGTELYRRICKVSIETTDDRTIEVGCVLAVSIATNLPGILGSLLIGLTFPSQTGSGTYMGGFVSISVIAIIAIGIVGTLGNIAFRYANLETKNLSVNAMQYLRPVFTLIWLGLFATVTVYRTDFLWIGATAVIAVNTLINFRSEERAGFKWFVLCLLGFGFTVYIRDEWFPHIPGYGSFPAFGDYYGFLGAGATVFVLILSFRMSRLNRRTISEERRTYILCREMVGLAAEDKERQTILECVRAINTTRRTTQLKEAYEYVCQQIGNAGLSPSDTARLQADLDTLVNSRQRGRNMIELIVLAILAFVVATMAVFSRTEGAPWPALLNDVVTMLLASVVTFMTINLFDQRSDSDEPTITETGTVLFRDAARTSEHNPRVERAISICIGFAIVGVYVYLIVLKWLPI